MNGHDSGASPGARRLVAGATAFGAIMTGIFGLLGSIATIFAHPPMEAAVFIVASALAFGLLAIATFRN